MDLQRLDGLGVEIYDGKFSGTFTQDLPSAIDTEEYFVIRARTKVPVFAETKSGDIKRTDVFSVVEAAKVSAEAGLKLIASSSAQLSLLVGDDEDDEDDI